MELMPEVGVPNAVDGGHSQSGITKSEHLHGENLSLAHKKKPPGLSRVRKAPLPSWESEKLF
jgi:hypothetical protein